MKYSQLAQSNMLQMVLLTKLSIFLSICLPSKARFKSVLAETPTIEAF